MILERKAPVAQGIEHPPPKRPAARGQVAAHAHISPRESSNKTASARAKTGRFPRPPVWVLDA